MLCHKFHHGSIDLLWIRVAEIVLTTLNDLQPCIRAVCQQLDLLLGICNAVDDIGCAMSPKHRTCDIEQASKETIPITKAESRHARPFSALVTTPVDLDGISPELAVLLGNPTAEPSVDEEVTERVIEHVIGRAARSA